MWSEWRVVHEYVRARRETLFSEKALPRIRAIGQLGWKSINPGVGGERLVATCHS